MINKKSKEERQEEILNIVHKQEYVTVKSLTHLLQTSDMTIRRDVKALDHKLLLMNGIIMKHENGRHEKKYHIEIEKYAFEDEKRIIGKQAASLVKAGDTIAIDLGTSTEYMVDFLPNNIDILVICNAQNIFEKLTHKNIPNIVMCGGDFKYPTQSFHSRESLVMLENYRVTKAFMSAAGFSTKMGVTCINRYESPYKKKIMDLSMEKILLFDSSKYNEVRSVCYGDVTDFTKIITTANMSQEDKEILAENNVSYVSLRDNNLFSINNSET